MFYISHDKKYIAVLTQDCAILIYFIEDNLLLLMNKIVNVDVDRLAISHDNNFLAVLTLNHKHIYIWDISLQNPEPIFCLNSVLPKTVKILYS